tara:strand:+ start:134 stop:778 length:645 start_codon:yes stop_codon:yes gene_type:complete
MSSTRIYSVIPTFVIMITLLVITGCATSIPSSPEDLCGIFEEKRNWFLAAKRTRDRWNAPIGITMAFIYQESSYKANARPEREKIFGIIPWRRKSTAVGYAQAIDSTWKQYINDPKVVGDWRPKYRTNFNDAVDFVGWYNYQSQKQLNLSLTDARNLYLTYHEGWRGYKNGTYKKKRWLIKVADKVDARARLYETQYLKCKHKLSRWYDFLLPR